MPVASFSTLRKNGRWRSFGPRLSTGRGLGASHRPTRSGMSCSGSFFSMVPSSDLTAKGSYPRQIAGDQGKGEFQQSTAAHFRSRHSQVRARFAMEGGDHGWA